MKRSGLNLSLAPKLALAAVVAGFVAGPLDILAAALINQVAPVRVLKFVASGLMGRAAAHAGGPADAWTSAAWTGLALQVGMSAALALGYATPAVAWRRYLERPLVSGAVFGVAVYFVMTDIVVPLSRAPTSTDPTPLASVAAQLAVMLVFGVIVAFIVRALARRSEGDVRPAGMKAGT